MRHVGTRGSAGERLETEVCEPPVAEAVALSEIEEQISTRESSPQPEPIEQGQPVPYQIVVSAEQSAEIAAPEKPEIAAVAEIAGVGRAIAGLGALPDGTEIPTTSDEEHFASQPTTIETMPETLQTPTAPRHSSWWHAHGCSNHPLLRNRFDAANARFQDSRAAIAADFESSHDAPGFIAAASADEFAGQLRDFQNSSCAR